MDMQKTRNVRNEKRHLLRLQTIRLTQAVLITIDIVVCEPSKLVAAYSVWVDAASRLK
jgi:type IV secretory pathway component VirB8